MLSSWLLHHRQSTRVLSVPTSWFHSLSSYCNLFASSDIKYLSLSIFSPSALCKRRLKSTCPVTRRRKRKHSKYYTGVESVSLSFVIVLKFKQKIIISPNNRAPTHSWHHHLNFQTKQHSIVHTTSPIQIHTQSHNHTTTHNHIHNHTN